MSTANALVRPGFDINLERLRTYVEQFAVVALYTTPRAGAKVVETTVDPAQPHHLGTLDVLIVINSNTGLLDDETRIQRQLDVQSAVVEHLYPEARVGTYIILGIKSKSGQAYNVGDIGEMTMAAAAQRARILLGEDAQLAEAS